MTGIAPRRPRRSEAEIVAAAARHLREIGYRVYPDPDGTDYFDLVARRGIEVGLVEAKVADGRGVLVQALRRRGWGDWTAVVVGSAVTADRLVARTRGGRAEPVGVWSVPVEGSVRVHRAASVWARDPTRDPWAELRGRLGRILDAVDAGERPSEVRWDDVAREVRRASGARGFREWRLDEPAPDER